MIAYCSAVVAVAVAAAAGPVADPPPVAEVTVLKSGSGQSLDWLGMTPGGRHLVVRVSWGQLGSGNGAEVRVLDLPSGRLALAVPIRVDVTFGRCGGECAVDPGGRWVAYGEGGRVRFIALPPTRPADGGPAPAGPAEDGPPETDIRRYGEGAVLLGQEPGTVLLATYKATFRVAAVGRDGGAGKELFTRPQSVSSSSATFHPRTGRLAFIECVSSVDGVRLARCRPVDGSADEVTVADRGKSYSPTALAFAPDGRSLAVGYIDGRVAVADPATGKAVREFSLGSPERRAVLGLVFHPSGRYLVCGTGDGNANPKLIVLDARTDGLVVRMSAAPRGVGHLALDPKGERLATCGAAGAVKVWDFDALLRGR